MWSKKRAVQLEVETALFLRVRSLPEVNEQPLISELDFCGNFAFSSEGNSGTIVEEGEAKFTQNPVVKLYNASYFEAARRLRVRSLLGVNEQPEIKADAKRAALYEFYSVM